MIPEYRVKFYCLLGMLFFLGVACLSWPELYQALATLEMDARTGSRSSRVTVHLIYHRDPIQFITSFIGKAATALLTTALGLGLTWRLVRGRKAFSKGQRFD